MANVAAADFVGGADRDGAAGAGFGTEVALLLHDDYYAVACEGGVRARMMRGRTGGGQVSETHRLWRRGSF